MIGTLEPRKNHKYLIDAFDKGLDTNIIIAGRKGWNIDMVYNIITKHDFYGTRLFWFDSESDIDIDYLY